MAVPKVTTFTLSDKSLTTGEKATVYVMFSEKVKNFDVSDFGYSGGSLTGSLSSDGKSWTGTFTPSSNTLINSATIAVKSGGYVDAATGKYAGTASSSITYLVDTKAPTATISLDKTTLTAGQTATVTVKFSEKVTAFNNSDLTVKGGTLSNLTSSDSITWKGTFIPTANSTTEGKVSVISNGYTDIAGNKGGSAVSSSISIDTLVDTKAPTATISLDKTTLTAGQTATVTVKFSENVRDVDLRDFNADNAKISNFKKVDDKTYTMTLTANDVEKSGNKFYVSALYTDSSNNQGTAASTSFSIVGTKDLTIDSITPKSLTVTQGDNFSFGYIVKNLGSGAVSSTETSILLDGKQLSGYAGWDYIASMSAKGSVDDSNSFSTSGLSIGKHTLTIKADNKQVVSESNESNNTKSIEFIVTAKAGAKLPEIAVSGNNVNIVDGDTSPSTGDYTDFGSVATNATVTRTFTVTNTGTETLTTSGLSVPTGFTVTEGLSASIAAGAKDTFTVSMDTKTAGTKSGPVSFKNNDADEGTFNFDISGKVGDSTAGLTATQTKQLDTIKSSITQAATTDIKNGANLTMVTFASGNNNYPNVNYGVNGYTETSYSGQCVSYVKNARSDLDKTWGGSAQNGDETFAESHYIDNNMPIVGAAFVMNGRLNLEASVTHYDKEGVSSQGTSLASTAAFGHTGIVTSVTLKRELGADGKAIYYYLVGYRDSNSKGEFLKSGNYPRSSEDQWDISTGTFKLALDEVTTPKGVNSQNNIGFIWETNAIHEADVTKINGILTLIVGSGMVSGDYIKDQQQPFYLLDTQAKQQSYVNLIEMLYIQNEKKPIPVDELSFNKAYIKDVLSGATVGTSSDENLTGTNDSDIIYGAAGNDALNGRLGNDALNGGLGNDTLNGGLGNDALTGGLGSDVFVFNVTLSNNSDRIMDFKVDEDKIHLSKTIFTKLSSTGSLAESNFSNAGKATDNNDYIVYDKNSGTFYYDADGSGAGAVVKIGVLDNHPLNLSYSDFIIIA